MILFEDQNTLYQSSKALILGAHSITGLKTWIELGNIFIINCGRIIFGTKGRIMALSDDTFIVVVLQIFELILWWGDSEFRRESFLHCLFGYLLMFDNFCNFDLLSTLLW